MNEPTDKIKSQLIEFDEPFVEPKIGSAAWMMAPRLPQLMQKAGRFAVVYGLSYAAVKALDQAAEMNPSSKLIAGADQIANVVFGWENLAVGGAVMIAEAGYDALTKPKPPAPESLAASEIEPANINPPHPKHKHHRSRAPLNAKLAPELREPAPPLFGDVGIEVTPVPKGKREMPEPQ